MDEDRMGRDARQSEPSGGREFPARKVRQGRQGFQVLLVLVVALILAVLVWAFVEIYSEGRRDENRELETGSLSVGETVQELAALPLARHD